LRAQVRTTDLQSQQALLAYRQTVLAAFHEVDDAMLAYAEEQRRSAALAPSRWDGGTPRRGGQRVRFVP
jgi:outer membrane protein TolC